MSKIRVLITGSNGLVGSECAKHFTALGWSVCGVDNNQREKFFGADGVTTTTGEWKTISADIRSSGTMGRVIDDYKPDLIVHAAAQPSHDYAATHVLEDWSINATATVQLLELSREFVPQATFAYISTNKVYGDGPNNLTLIQDETRYRHTRDQLFTYPECATVDQVTHSLFGVSKLAADLAVQEYGRYFGMNTACFRCGCLTGAAHAGAEQHGFLAYLVKCAVQGRKYRIYGYDGKQVRDNLHACDLARAVELFHRDPRQGEVYNLGGGLANSVSIIEAVALIKELSGIEVETEYVDTPRKGDHQWYVSRNEKFILHYPQWRVSRDLEQILTELLDG